MIDKILDRYYTRKLIKKMEWTFKVYNIDYKHKIKENKVYYSIKPKKYKDKFYKEIINIDREDSLEYFIHYEEFTNSIHKIIKEKLDKMK